MASKQATKPDGEADQKEQSAKQATAAIGRAVMTALGRPANFLQVTVRQVSSDNYRVNVVTGADPSSASIAHSYFVGVDEQGNVAKAQPAIVKLY